MKFVVLFVLLLTGCAFSEANIPLAISMVAKGDKDMEKQLATIPIEFVAFVNCGGVILGADGRVHDTFGCYYPQENRIEVATVKPGKSGLEFRYEEEMFRTVRHELIHAKQMKEYGRTWHPIEQEMSPN